MVTGVININILLLSEQNHRIKKHACEHFRTKPLHLKVVWLAHHTCVSMPVKFHLANYATVLIRSHEHFYFCRLSVSVAYLHVCLFYQPVLIPAGRGDTASRGLRPTRIHREDMTLNAI